MAVWMAWTKEDPMVQLMAESKAVQKVLMSEMLKGICLEYSMDG
jgi:hypothetical protein